MVGHGGQHLVGRIFANLFVWGILMLGAFFMVVFKDYTIGLELAILALCKLFISHTTSAKTNRF